MSDFGPHNPIRIVRLEQTTFYRPSQWEGYTSQRAAVYVRFRWGELTVHVGDPSLDEHVDPVFEWHDNDDDTNGEMTTEGLRIRLPDWITISGVCA